MQQLEITSADGTAIPLSWFEAEAPRAKLLLLPALGIQCKLYDKLAAGLAEVGCSVCLMEQRGHGRSPIKVRRGTDYCLGDFLDYDIPATLEWLRHQSPGAPLLIGGHSLGGHLSTIYTGQHPEAVAGVVHLACAFPYHGDYGGSSARMVRLLCRLLPLFRIVPGYYPGNVMGFGGKESVHMMRQWSEWASTGRFDFGGRTGLAEAVSAFKGPVISISFDRDDFASEAAISRANAPFTGASVTRIHLGSKEQGDFLGHTGWAREPSGVVAALQDWLPRVSGASGNGESQPADGGG